MLKYGETHPYKNIGLDKNIIEQIKITKYNNLYKNIQIRLNKLKNNDKLLYVNNNDRLISLKCATCDNIYKIKFGLFKQRQNLNSCICTLCKPISLHISGQHINIINYIKENYSGEIIINDRKTLNGKELDIYLPELNIAFEFNGLYWHSEVNKDKNYHLNKTNLCQKRGIQLIHIWEDEWIYKNDIIKSIILNKLNKSTKIFARKCIIKEVNNTITKQFLIKNHILGYTSSKINLGLYYNDELVSLISFGLTNVIYKYKTSNNIVLLRFCNKLNTIVVGGASKLFKHFINNYQFNEIITYCNNDKYIGNIYSKLGFNLQKYIKPNYYWIINNIRESKFNWRKDKLVKLGYDINKTEIEIMHELGCLRIYDVGTDKYIFKNN